MPNKQEIARRVELQMEQFTLETSQVLQEQQREADAIRAKVDALPEEVRSLVGKVIWVRQPSYPWWPAYAIHPAVAMEPGPELWHKGDATKELLVVFEDGATFGRVRIASAVRTWSDEATAELRQGMVPPKGKLKAKRCSEVSSSARE